MSVLAPPQKQGSSAKKVCAFFDVDETIWNAKSILAFYKFYLDNTEFSSSSRRWDAFQGEVKAVIESGISREDLNAWFYREKFRNVSIEHIRQLSAHWYHMNSGKDEFWRGKVVDVVEKHSCLGHAIVFVSGSFRELLLPLKQRFSAADILCAPLEEKNGHYTGHMTDIPMIGYGKKKAISSFIRANNVDADSSFAYGDDETDIPFLQLVGNAYLVSKPGVHDGVTFTKLQDSFI